MRRHEIIRIGAGALVAECVPSFGGAIHRVHEVLPAGGTFDWLRPGSDDSFTDALPLREACFPLVPYANLIRHGSFSHAGQSIVLAKNFPRLAHSTHGTAWQRAWTVESSGAAHVAMSLEAGIEKTPYRYRATQQLEMRSRTLEVTLAVENRSDEPLPFGLGLHPYFPDAEHATLQASCESYWQIDAEHLPLRRCPAQDEMSFSNARPLAGRRLNHCFERWKQTATMTWSDVPRSIHMRATGPLEFLQVYVPNHEYFCVEPVSHAVDAFNLASNGELAVGLVVLEPGESLSADVVFEFCWEESAGQRDTNVL